MTTVIIPAPGGNEPVITNTSFWPDVEPEKVRRLMRLEQTVTAERLRHAIMNGIAETNAELYHYSREQMAAGYRRLADVPADLIDGESEKCFHYLRAISAFASATIYERYRGYDASGKGLAKAADLDQTIDELWRDARWAVSRLQGQPRSIIGHI